MNFFKKTCFFVLLTFSVSILTGCAVAAIGAGVAMVKYANAKKKETYNDYTLEMQKINLEREKANLKPEYIMSYEEYKKGKIK